MFISFLFLQAVYSKDANVFKRKDSIHKVEELKGDAALDTLMKDIKGLILVLYYREGCGYCKNILEYWKTLHVSQDITLAMTSNKNVLEQCSVKSEEIKGTPMVFLFYRNTEKKMEHVIVKTGSIKQDELEMLVQEKIDAL